MLIDPQSRNPCPPITELGRRKIALIALMFLWCAATALGALCGIGYERTASPTTKAPPSWPPESTLRLAPDRPTLVMFVHPQCPCARASLEELDILLARCGDHVAVHIVFPIPSGASSAWMQTEIAKSASAIRGVSIVQDFDSADRRRFAAHVSGEAFLFVPEGRLVFHGGITPSRGHAGDNLGRSMIQSCLDRSAGAEAMNDNACFQTPVYGCPL